MASAHLGGRYGTGYAKTANAAASKAIRRLASWMSEDATYCASEVALARKRLTEKEKCSAAATARLGAFKKSRGGK